MTFYRRNGSFFYKKTAVKHIVAELQYEIFILNLHWRKGVLAHLVERNTGSVEVSGSSPLCSTTEVLTAAGLPLFIHLRRITPGATRRSITHATTTITTSTTIESVR